VIIQGFGKADMALEISASRKAQHAAQILSVRLFKSRGQPLLKVTLTPGDRRIRGDACHAADGEERTV
jgi:hypothetical protein